MRSVIAGVGSFLPEKILYNRDLERMVDTSDEWIVERTGIRQRRIANANISASDLAVPAGKKALDSAGLAPEDVELIIVGTSTPDMLFPSTACFVQAKLGARRAAAFDLQAACSGFTFSLATADNFLKSGGYKNALVIGAEVYSSIVNWKDRTTCVLFGDGAGAVALRAEESESGILSTHIFSDGSKADYLYAPGGGSSHRFTPEMVSEKKYCLKMQGRETFTVAVKSMVRAARVALEFNSIAASDLKLVIPHQANKRIISAVAKQLGMADEKCFSNVEKYGNTAAASFAIALDDVLREGRAKKGDLILTVTFGGGFTWGAMLIRL